MAAFPPGHPGVPAGRRSRDREIREVGVETRFHRRTALRANSHEVAQRAVLRELGPGVPGAGLPYATGSFEMLPVAEESAGAELVGGPTAPTDRASQHRGKPIDRDH